MSNETKFIALNDETGFAENGDEINYSGSGKSQMEAIKNFRKAHLSEVCAALDLKAGDPVEVSVYKSIPYAESEFFDPDYPDPAEFPFDYVLSEKVATIYLVCED